MFIDTHAHIYLDKFQNDIEEVIQRASNEKVEKILLPNIDVSTTASMFALSSRFPGICYPMIGLHPCSVGEGWKEQIDDMMTLTEAHSVIGIGEIGIDLYWDVSLKKEQEAAYRYQIQLAKKKALPIVVHSRESIQLTSDIAIELQDGSLQGVFHCFTGDLEAGEKLTAAGFYLGIGGVLTFKNSRDLRQLIRKLPIERLILETDAPYLTPSPFRGQRNESSYIPYIAHELANVFDMSVSEIERITTENALRLFNLD